MKIITYACDACGAKCKDTSELHEIRMWFKHQKTEHILCMKCGDMVRADIADLLETIKGSVAKPKKGKK